MAKRGAKRRVGRARGLSAEQERRIKLTRGLSDEGLRSMPDDALRRALGRLNADNPARARQAFRQQQERDGRGRVPTNALMGALAQLDSLRVRSTSRRHLAGVPAGATANLGVPRMAAAGLSPSQAGWTALGPGNIGGRTRAIVIHPANPSNMWAGSAGGGVWRTDDGGGNWAPVDDLMANLAVSCLAMDPTNPDVIYAGTGEGFGFPNAIRGAGIFRTEDGVAWRQIPTAAGAIFEALNRLAVSPDGEVLLAATPSGLLRSADPARAVWDLAIDARMADVKFHPTSSAQAVAGGLNDGDAYFTNDGGRTWQAATHAGAWGGRVELAYALADPAIVYASVQARAGELWRSDDGGGTYVKCAALVGDDPAPFLGGYGWYCNVVWAGDPTDANLVLVGGINLWKSTDGGATLREISSWDAPPQRSCHADQHCIVSHPRYDGAGNRTVFFGNDGGVYKTEDLATVGSDPERPFVHGWVELVNSYGVTQFYAGAGNATSGTIIGGAQDNGTLRFRPADGPEGWWVMHGGDGGFCAADPGDPQVFYGEEPNLNIVRSTDGGESAELISGKFFNRSRGPAGEWDWKSVPFRITDAMNEKALFVAPFVLDPNEPNRILGGGLSLWRTDDAKRATTDETGPSWAPIKDSAGGLISAIAVAAGNSNLVWVGHEDGQVYRTEDGTSEMPVWRQMDHRGPKPLDADRFCTRIVVDPRHHATVYALFAGFTRSNVWKSTDGGETWSDIGAGLPAAPVRCLAIHPDRSDFLYLGAEVGVFASEDGGGTWSPTNEGPTNCSVDDLFWMGRTLVCATHGRGMFQIDLTL